MKSIQRQTAVRIGRAAGLLSAGLLAAIACKSFAIDETVYTGASTARAGSSSGASTAGGSASVAGSAGATSSQGGDVGSGGETASGGMMAAAGSSNEEPEIPAEPFSKAALLRQVSECAVARFDDFKVHALALDAATKALDASPSEETAAAARSAWLTANASWQVAELFRFGPAARSTDADPGYQDLRDQIYAWRLGGRCPVDTALVDQAYAAGNFGSSLIQIRGLGAAEYLLFYGQPDNGCRSFDTINANGSWSALNATEIGRRRRTYAAAVAADILLNAQKLASAWDPAQGNFKAKLASPGKASSPYADEQAALNAVFHGSFYIEKEVKDFKLAIPLARSPECFTALCPEQLESRFANVSQSNLRLNFVGFRRLFQGCGANYSGLGFDDWLDAVGASNLKTRMVVAITNAEKALNDLNPPIEISLIEQTAHVHFVYDQLKVFTDIFKTEFLSTLNLDLPPDAGQDND